MARVTRVKRRQAGATLKGVPITPIDCPDSHNVGLNCEMAEVFRQVLPLAAEEYDGFFVVDDDSYLNVPWAPTK